MMERRETKVVSQWVPLSVWEPASEKRTPQPNQETAGIYNVCQQLMGSEKSFWQTLYCLLDNFIWRKKVKCLRELTIQIIPPWRKGKGWSRGRQLSCLLADLIARKTDWAQSEVCFRKQISRSSGEKNCVTQQLKHLGREVC